MRCYFVIFQAIGWSNVAYHATFDHPIAVKYNDIDFNAINFSRNVQKNVANRRITGFWLPKSCSINVHGIPAKL